MNKHDALNILGKQLMDGKKISSNDEELLMTFECTSRTLKRYLDELSGKYGLKEVL